MAGASLVILVNDARTIIQDPRKVALIQMIVDDDTWFNRSTWRWLLNFGKDGFTFERTEFEKVAVAR